MISLSYVEEDYLKAIYKIFERTGTAVNTNAIAQHIDTSAASVTDMLKKLSEKELIHYEKYKGVSLKHQGNLIATQLVRKHRLWEVFLVSKLGFSWDEVHDIAEQLEHIKSDKLIELLDIFLDHPKYDPHGDPIPDQQGKFVLRSRFPLTEVSLGTEVIIVGVNNHTTPFLQYLDSQKISLGSKCKTLEKFDFDQSIRLVIDDNNEITISQMVAKNLLVKIWS